MKILCFGDSNTYGFDPRGFFGGRYEDNGRWPEMLGALSSHQVINQGQNGRTIPHRENEAALFRNTLENTKPDLLIIMLGTNDLLTGCAPDDACRRMEYFLSHVPEGIKVMLIAPPAIRRGEWVQDEGIIEGIHKIAELYRTLARERGTLFLAAGSLPLSYDGVHLSREGNRQLAKKAWDIIREIPDLEDI